MSTERKLIVVKQKKEASMIIGAPSSYSEIIFL